MESESIQEEISKDETVQCRYFLHFKWIIFYMDLESLFYFIINIKTAILLIRPALPGFASRNTTSLCIGFANLLKIFI